MEKLKCLIVTPFKEEDIINSLKEYITNHKHSLYTFEAKTAEYMTSRSLKYLKEHILNCIKDSDVVITNISEPNENVWAEIGMAITLRKPLLFLTRSKQELASDIQGIYYLRYENVKDLERQMPIYFEGLLNEFIAGKYTMSSGIAEIFNSRNSSDIIAQINRKDVNSVEILTHNTEPIVMSDIFNVLKSKFKEDPKFTFYLLCYNPFSIFVNFRAKQLKKKKDTFHHTYKVNLERICKEFHIYDNFSVKTFDDELPPPVSYRVGNFVYGSLPTPYSHGRDSICVKYDIRDEVVRKSIIEPFKRLWSEANTFDCSHKNKGDLISGCDLDYSNSGCPSICTSPTT